ncbi:MAG TPA: sulfotransferase family protein [Porticoccaceae bacterium]|nr:sulfotransferase family protein [Porticoccaceae bacterium]HCO61745.1 sulfotransferase family protein [Porticoccaceae bacterium]
METTDESNLEVIGAGFGRTGTLSMRAALGKLGLGPVHHMFEVVKAPEQSSRWLDALEDSRVLREVLAGYRSAVDWPTCYFYRELMDLYPQAKVILTHREPRGWYKSIRNTIYRLLTAKTSDMPTDQVNMARRIVMDLTFDGRLGEEDYAINVFEKHNAAVKAAVPSERLLVFDVREGWQPLCDFLDKPVPDEPFPQTNSTEELIGHFRTNKA